MRKLVILIIVMLFAMPISWIATIIIHPFWRWLEDATGIESFGHSGPTDWCFWFDYCILVVLVAIIVLRTKARKKQSKINVSSNKSP